MLAGLVGTRSTRGCVSRPEHDEPSNLALRISAVRYTHGMANGSLEMVIEQLERVETEIKAIQHQLDSQLYDTPEEQRMFAAIQVSYEALKDELEIAARLFKGKS
jgi:hypothetical protein